MPSAATTPPAINPRLLVDRREAARLLCISERTLWSVSKAGELPPIKIRGAVRYCVRDLQDYIDRHRASGSGQ